MIVLSLAIIAALGNDVEEAKRAEVEAFAAIDAKQYCDAVALFLDANRLAPAPELLFNAARAAELATDRTTAARLYDQLLLTANDATRAKVEKRLAKLKETVDREGTGGACAPREPAIVLAATAVSAASVIEPVAVPPPAAVEPVTPTEVATETAHPPIMIPTSTSPKDSTPLFLTMTAGAVVTLAGCAVTVLGAQPWVTHNNTQMQLRALEAQDAPSRELTERTYARQLEAENAWNTWGQATVIAGITSIASGLTVLTIGGAWIVLDEGAQ
jgi:hypothetical protein